MTSKRFNMWIDDELLVRIKAAAKTYGLKAAPYIRIAVLEKLGESAWPQPNSGRNKKTK